MRKWGRRIVVGTILLLALLGLRSCFHNQLSFEKAIGVLELEGTLWVADEWLRQIEEFRKNPRIMGVVVRIQSPGGTVAASQEIYEGLKQLAAVKPVVASMGTIAASGGLYVALGANKIVADAGTITGSIGVRMQHLNVGSLMRLFRIDSETLKSGRLKDMGSMTRDLTAEERTLLTDLMVEIHGQFKEAIVASRGLTPEAVEKIADGRIFSGVKGKDFGLVDEIGNLQHAVRVAAGLAKIEGEPKLIYGEQPYSIWFKAIFGMVRSALSGPVAYYLYP